MIGAGASYGESLSKKYPQAQQPRRTPPLINGFFDRRLTDDLEYVQPHLDFADVIEYIKHTKLLTDDFGEGQWTRLDLEEVFTSLEVEREFHNPDSDQGARLLLRRNALIRYIRRILGLCTSEARGTYCRRLVENLDSDDSVVTFNWDLLVDQEFMDLSSPGVISGQYLNFLYCVPLSRGVDLRGYPHSEGLFLKLHGSLNWFRCGNQKCEVSARLFVVEQTQLCLD